jgi:hypothetical protein
MRSKRLFLGIVLLLVFCISGQTEAAKASLNKKTATMYVGDSITLKVKNVKHKIKWKSSNKKVVEVSQKGKITAKKKGTASVTAQYGKKKLTCKITVKKKNSNNKNNKKNESKNTETTSAENSNTEAANTEITNTETNEQQTDNDKNVTDNPANHQPNGGKDNLTSNQPDSGKDDLATDEPDDGKDDLATDEPDDGKDDLTTDEPDDSAAEDSQSKMVVYTANTKSNSDTSGDGTKENPYNRFEDAVENVSDGGTIYIESGKSGFLNTQDEYGSLPYVISKSVTISAEPGADTAELLVRCAGIILGGNVTFHNIQLSYANKYHNGIFANGYHLVLDNVSRGSSARLVNVFAGSLVDVSSGKIVGAYPGEAAWIEIQGSNTEIGNVYGGSLNGGYKGNVDIDLKDKMTIGDVYACGAQEPTWVDNNWFDLTEPALPEAKPNSDTVSGKVDISLNNASVTTVDGSGAQGGTTVSVATQQAATKSIKGVQKLIVSKGRLILSSFAFKDGNAGKIAVEEEGVLDLTDNENVKSITCDSFEGGGKVVMKSDGLLVVNNAVSGETKLEILGNTFINNHVYIDTKPENSGTFVLDTTLEDKERYQLQKDEQGKWSIIDTVTAGQESVLSGIKMPEKVSVTYNQINQIDQTGKVSPSIAIQLTGVPDGMDVSDYSFGFTVEYNGVTYAATEDQDYTGTGYVNDLHMELYVTESEKDSSELENGCLAAELNIYPLVNEDATGSLQYIAAGNYTITVFYDNPGGTKVSATSILHVAE